MPTLFISYKRGNKVAVTKITAELANKYHYHILRDIDEFLAGEDWRVAARAAIDKADAILLMLTPASCASGPVLEEIVHAREVGCKVIPLLIEPCTPEDLDKLGMRDITHISFLAGDDETEAWRRLLDHLHRYGLRVLARDKRMLNPDILKLHRDYLKTLFTRLGKVNLTYLLDKAPRERVKLMDVYVPLKLNVSFNLDVLNGDYVDWWLRPLGEETPLELPEGHAKPKVLDGFAPQGDALAAWDERMRQRWIEFKAEREKDGKTKLDDGTYRWGRIESEIAPALMPHLVITGSPGSGKSTLVRHLALCLAGNKLEEGEDAKADINRLQFWPLNDYTPVFIDLRDLAQKLFPTPATRYEPNQLLDAFLAYLKQQLGESLAGYADDLRDQMREGAVMFFLDGLDEVPEAETDARRAQIKEFVSLLREQFNQCRILVTSRPHAYKAEDWRLNDFGHVELASLDEDRLEELALRLFRVVLGQEGAEEEAPQFKARMEADVPEDLRASPLYFTLLAALWLNNPDAPPEDKLPKGGASALYRACVDMLMRRCVRKDLDGRSLADEIGLGETQLRLLLERLAHDVHSAGSGDTAIFTSGDITNLIDELGLGQPNVFKLRDALAQRIGLTHAKSPGKFEFAHRSFQEHLAAAHLSAPERYPAQIVAHLRREPSAWRNVMDLLPGEAGAQGRDLWELLNTLLPKGMPTPTERDDSTWSLVYQAARLLNRLPADDRRQDLYRPLLRDLLVALIETGALDPRDRAEMRRVLSTLGDPRPGVGLRNGLPDIDWVPIPDDGEWIYQKDKHRPLPVFKISRYPVTYAQFQAFVDAPDALQEDWWRDMRPRERKFNNQEFVYDNHPRENVTWYQAVAFTRWLSDKLGYEVTLPTEQQWEKAARGTDGRVFPYEGAFDAAKGNIGATGIGQTTAVGLFPTGKSPYGVLDMSGNVWEWCLNKYDHPDQTQIDDSGDARVLRGGSGDFRNTLVASFRQDYGSPVFRFSYVGLRLVLFAPIRISDL